MLESWRKIFPNHKHLDEADEQTLRCFTYFEPQNTKCIIIGQDPYPAGADGLAFSCQKIRPSVNKIFNCMVKRGLLAHKPQTGNLQKWAERGVLLINSALTYGVPIHAHWYPTVAKILQNLSEIANVPVFVWGAKTKKLMNFDRYFQNVYYAAHPASNGIWDFDGFEKVDINWELN